MKTYLDCIPCFFKQGLDAARIITQDKVIQKKILDEIAMVVPEFSLNSTPPEMGRIIHKIVRKFTHSSDPYKKIKDKYNKAALKLYPELKKKVRKSKDPLLTAIKIAIAGNVIDFGVNEVRKKINLGKELKNTLEQNFAILDYDKLKNCLEKTKEILYLGDNTGEIVFDRILIEELPQKVIYVVRDKPIINDVTIEDALFCRIDKVAKVISSGCDAPGTILRYCSKEFLNYYTKTKLIISKGQGNYETLSEEKRPIFFLLKAKCPVIARNLGCRVGDIILKTQGSRYTEINPST